MSQRMSSDVLVIGRGLLGSATARHLALENAKVTLIGPTEEQGLNSGKVFASHYDQTRVQRIVAHDELWTRLNLDSVKSWSVLKDQTGTDFYEENGCIYANNFLDDYLKSAPSLADKFGLEIHTVDSSLKLSEISPCLSIEASFFGLFEPKLAGMLNPRKLVSAQLQALKLLGGTELNDFVVDVSPSDGQWSVRTSTGMTHVAPQVVVAAGAFTNHFNLIPKALDFYNKSEVVIVSEVSESDYLKLKGMPSLLFEIKEDDFDGIYLTAPTKTADGRYIMKLGLNQKLDLNLNDYSDLVKWFNAGDYSEYAPVLVRERNRLFPEVKFLNSVLKPCVISRTVTENPYIEEIAKGLFVAVGCNGYSAMSSDAQGRQAAALVTNGIFDIGYTKENFKAVFK
jgi:glycine/D-amino acid oxidase-like deaminating enzyme